MDAELGSNPSYVWRSLLAAREIIWEGSSWRMGDGNTIGVTTYKWFSHRPIFLAEQQMGLKVKNLIGSNTMHWDREKILVSLHTRHEWNLCLSLCNKIQQVGMYWFGQKISLNHSQ